MADLKGKLEASAVKIVDQVKELTSDAQFGIGGYTDKPIVPFAYDPNSSDKAEYKQYKKILAYQHHLKMTDDANKVKEKFAEIELAANVDDPESNFDALAQAMLCKDIGTPMI